MLLKTDPALSKLARNLALGIQKSVDGSLPREYLNLEGFRLTQEPRRRSTGLFLGSLSAWGGENLKLCPKMEFLFHESDFVVANLQSPVCRNLSSLKKKDFIDAAEFENFCLNLIPEKLLFILEERQVTGALGAETLNAVERVGARAVLSSEMIRLEQGLFFQPLRGGGSRVKAQRDLAEMGCAQTRKNPIMMAKRKLDAQGLGRFVAMGETYGEEGALVQVEFAQFHGWEIERVRWESLKQKRTPGGWMITC